MHSSRLNCREWDDIVSKDSGNIVPSVCYMRVVCGKVAALKEKSVMTKAQRSDRRGGNHGLQYFEETKI